jgi:hypothetical protein
LANQQFIAGRNVTISDLAETLENVAIVSNSTQVSITLYIREKSHWT